MPSIFHRSEKKPDADIEHARNMALTEHGRPQMTDEMANMLGQTAFMIQDPEMDKILLDDNKLKSMYPAFSSLNRTTNHPKEIIDLLRIKYEVLLLINEVEMDEDQFNENGWSQHLSLSINKEGILSDAREGFRARIVTEQRKRITTEVQTPKKKRWGIF